MKIQILVCIKQVPSSQRTMMNSEKGTLIRIATDSMINPYDLHAIEAALRTVETQEGKVSVMTMGPPSAERVLCEALAMGAEEGFLLSDNSFAGADVYATSYTLAQGIQKAGRFDLIFCGQQTTDGDTAQVPFALAAHLGIPVIGWVKKIEQVREDEIVVLQEVTGGTLRITAHFPTVLAVGRAAALQPRLSNLSKRLKALEKPLTVWSAADFPTADYNYFGAQGSPTRVQKIYSPTVTTKVPLIQAKPDEAAALILTALNIARQER